MNRRDLLRLALGAPLLNMFTARLDRASIEAAPWRVIASDGQPAKGLRVARTWTGNVCRSRLVNGSRATVRVKEVVLFDVEHGLPPDTSFYGEGFQMLSQTGGTIGEPVDLGNYTDAKHYKLPEPAGAKTVYGLVTFGPAAGPAKAGPHSKQHAGPHHYQTIAFGSCRRFNGKFNVRSSSLEVVLDAEGLELRPHEEWELEEFGVFTDRKSVV